MIKKIVLTGGPCAGKTTALAKIEQDLTEKGYKVFIVSESATELIKSGISPTDKKGIGLYEFQKFILLYQLQKENFYNNIVEKFPHDKKIIIYDRGLLDNKAYISEKEFNKILKYGSKELGYKLTESDIINRYDMVIHLVTSAEGNGNNYTLENNTARTETIEEARKLDKKTIESWMVHDNLQIIDNCDEFEEKINNVLNTIHNFLGNPVSIKRERKFLLNNFSLNNLKKHNFTVTEIKQYYLDTGVTDKYERRLRKTTYKDGINYYYRIQGKEKYGIKRIVLERKISKEEFENILDDSKVISKLNKKRYTFVYDKQYFKLDVFDDLSILEVSGIKEIENIKIPNEFEIMKEVTDEDEYQNINLGIK